ncbi:MAG: MoaD/ThiS family protein [Chloroflexota bacterium]
MSTHVRVEVHLHADLERYAPGARRGVLALVLPIGAQVGDVLRELALPADRRVLVGLNGATANIEQVLEDGARIDLVPPIAGGSHLEDTCRTVTGIAFSTSI